MPEIVNSRRFFLYLIKIFSTIKFLGSNWPAVLLISLFLFRGDIQEVLTVLSKKITQTSHMDASNNAVKISFSEEVYRDPQLKKFQKISKISPLAIKVALSGLTDEVSLFRFRLHQPDRGEISVVEIPSQDFIAAIVELENLKIIKIQSTMSSNEIQSKLDEFLRENPGYPKWSEKNHILWCLTTPLSDPHKIPKFDWKLTDYGKSFTSAILNTAAKQLSAS